MSGEIKKILTIPTILSTITPLS